MDLLQASIPADKFSEPTDPVPPNLLVNVRVAQSSANLFEIFLGITPIINSSLDCRIARYDKDSWNALHEEPAPRATGKKKCEGSRFGQGCAGRAPYGSW